MRKVLLGLCMAVALCGTAYAEDVPVEDGNSNYIRVLPDGTATTVPHSSVADQNMKAEHESFRQQAVIEDTMSRYQLTPQISPYQLFAGTVISGVLITGLNSDLPGNVVGQVSQNVYDSTTGSHLLIPQGTKLLGTYDSRTAFAQSRGAVIWQRMIFPNGKNIVIPNFDGIDREGYAGFKDKKRSHYSRVIWTALLGAAAIGGIETIADRKKDSDFAEKATAEAESNLSSPINKIVNKNLNIAPTIIIRPGYKFSIMIGKDLILEPYHQG